MEQCALSRSIGNSQAASVIPLLRVTDPRSGEASPSFNHTVLSLPHLFRGKGNHLQLPSISVVLSPIQPYEVGMAPVPEQFSATLSSVVDQSVVHAGLMVPSRNQFEFSTDEFSMVFPTEGMRLEAGGNGEIIITHENVPEWTMTCADSSILDHWSVQKKLGLRPQAKEIAGSRDSKRRLTGTFSFLALFLVLSFLGLKLGSWTVQFLAARIPESWQEKIGEEVRSEMAKTETFRGDMTNEVVMIEEMTAHLLKCMPREKNLKLRIFLMEDKTPNAAAAPGGYVFVTTGLLEFVQSPDQLAGVLAHEIAHLTRRHGLRQLIGAVGPFYALRLFVRDRNGFLTVVTGASAILMTQSFSRDYEREADRVAFECLSKSRFQPEGLEQVLGKLETLQFPGNGLHLERLSSHPPTPERIAALAKLRLKKNAGKAK